jgi:TolB-like protein
MTALTTSLGVAALAALVLWSLWPASSPSPTAPVAREIVVRVPAAAAIGANSSELATALTSTIQTVLVQSGMRVVNATSSVDGGAGAATFAVETTVQRAGDRGRAQVRLFRTNPDSSLWADQLDYRVAESFAAQDTLAARVRRAIQDAAARERPPSP